MSTIAMLPQHRNFALVGWIGWLNLVKPTSRPNPASFRSKLATLSSNDASAPLTAVGSVLPKYWDE